MQIGSYFSDKLLKIVCDPSLHKSDHPISTGSSQPFNNIHKGDPALDFIKYICAVLALDQNVQHEVLVCIFLHILGMVNVILHIFL